MMKCQRVLFWRETGKGRERQEMTATTLDDMPLTSLQHVVCVACDELP